ncbi:XshC-Cox1 family protein [Arthrobacter alpinus]|uniref:XshC-Cox1 family protein n=1 Tax=Arthrobacter alpinus TaxID=656366 RepID=A0A0M4QDU2_9MICC|nr:MULTISPECIES: XdhC family protein [Arthrobacter]ALE91267.1 XshC-Cox1 family protein [Arthrobacter alpinus]
MRDVLAELKSEWELGNTAGLATVVRTYKSAPRLAGASMLVTRDGRAVGSVSGGCVEGAVYELAREMEHTGTAVLQRYGVSDDDAFSVGLTCGGILDIFVEPVSPATFPELEAVWDDIGAGRPVAVATVIRHPSADWVGRRLVVRPADSDGSLGHASADHAVAEDARGLLAAGRTSTLGYGPQGQRRGEGMEIFVASYAPRPRMLIFGAIDFAAAVASQGSLLGYDVTVCDARNIFATAARFPDADQVIVDWPHRYLKGQLEAGLLDGRTVICVLTHDPKFDVPLLEIALRIPALAFVGAMGSRRTHEDRMERLVQSGLRAEELARLSSPIGLDLGSRTPQETAVSIVAEIISKQWGGSGEPLSGISGSIHGSSHESREPWPSIEINSKK